MEQSRDGYRHHVVGAVHEIIVTSHEPAKLRDAVDRELNDCHAGRIVIDLTRVDGVGVELLDAIEEVADHERAMVRLEQGATPVHIGDLER